MRQAHSESYGWQVRSSALALAGLALAGCSSDREVSAPPETTIAPSAEPNPPITDAPTTVSPEAGSCTAVQVPVFPGSRLNLQNADSIQKQLDALEVAKTPGAEVGVRTLFNANAIVVNALADNVYAESFSSVVESPADRLPNAESLLMTADTDLNQECLTGMQLQQVDRLYTTLLDGLGPQVGRQLGAAGQVGYDTLRDNYDRFRQRYEEELATR